MISSILYCFILSMQCLIFTKHLVDCNSRLILGTITVSESVRLKSDVRGTQREILRKKTSKQQQSVNKAFWSHFQHFGRLLEKMYLFLTPLGPARLTEEFPTNKVHLQPATWLTGGWGRKLGGPKGRFLTNKTYQLFYLNPELPFSQQHFPSKDMSFLPHLPASKHFPEEQIFRGKDPLAASVTWY